jgi:glycopeptidolipid biosynthesis protein
MDLLDEGEHAWLDGWGNPGGVEPAGEHAGVDSGVVRYAGGRAPEAVALSCGGRSLTYREVEEAR